MALSYPTRTGWNAATSSFQPVEGHDGVRSAEGHHQLSAAPCKLAQVGIFRVEIRRELGGVGIDVRTEIDLIERLVRAEDPLEKIQVPVCGFDGTAERNAVEDAFAGHGMPRSVEEFAERRRVLVGQRRVLFSRERDDASMSCALQRGSETNFPAAAGFPATPCIRSRRR